MTSLTVFAMMLLHPISKEIATEASYIKSTTTLPRKLPDDERTSTFFSYQTSEIVDEYAAIDQDLSILIEQTSLQTNVGLEHARNIYSKGTYSQSYASLKVASGDTLSLSSEIPAGSSVSGMTADDGSQVDGFIMTTAKKGDTDFSVQYNFGSKCFVGGNPSPDTDGCFAPSGTVLINGEESIDYTYRPLDDNFNGNSLQRLHKTNTASISDTYTDYSGSDEYSDRWILAALNGISTTFPNLHVDFDFTQFGLEGRAASARWGTVALSVWSYVSSKLEDAANSCNDNDQKGLFHWDQAVAVYSGLLPRTEGGDGNLLYSLAQEECNNFGTCVNDVADVNVKIFENFSNGKNSLSQKDCGEVTARVERIQALMTIPLVQKVIRMSYTLDKENKYEETIQGQAAAFAAAIVPLLHKCKESSAFTVYNDLTPGKGTTASYEVIRFALERTYECLGITCADVGGLINPDPNGDKYLDGGEPCGVAEEQSQQKTSSTTGSSQNKDDSNSSSTNNTGLIIGYVIGSISLVIVIVGFLMVKDRREKEFETNVAAGASDKMEQTAESDLMDEKEKEEMEII